MAFLKKNLEIDLVKILPSWYTTAKIECEEALLSCRQVFKQVGGSAKAKRVRDFIISYSAGLKRPRYEAPCPAGLNKCIWKVANIFEIFLKVIQMIFPDWRSLKKFQKIDSLTLSKFFCPGQFQHCRQIIRLLTNKNLS